MPSYSTLDHDLQFGTSAPTVSIYGTDQAGYIVYQMLGTFYSFAPNTKYFALQVIFDTEFEEAPKSIILKPGNVITEQYFTASPTIDFFVDGGNYPGAENSDITTSYFNISALCNDISTLGSMTLAWYYEVNDGVDEINTGTVIEVDTDDTLIGGPITESGTLGINLSNENTWLAQQDFDDHISIDGQLIDISDGASERDVLIYDGSAFTARPITADDIGVGFAISSFSPGFTTTKELGDTIINPGFTASYNATVLSATLQDNIDTQSLNSPFTSFTYGSSPLPARTYSSSTINGTISFTLSAIKSPSGPTKTSTITAAWRARRFYGLAEQPGSYNEAFIESLASSALASGYTGTYVFSSGEGTQRIYLCWPTAFGEPASIKDQNGFVFPMTKVATGVSLTNDFAVSISGGYDIWESGTTVAPFTLTVA